MSTLPAAVWGLSDSLEGPPAWVADDAAVARRLVAKGTDEIGPDVWWRVADVVRHCRVLTGPADPAYHVVDVLRDALRAGLAVADLLPLPPPPWLPRPSFDAAPAEEIALIGPRDYLVDVAAAALARALDDRSWTDPLVLAGLVDDLLGALACVAADVRAVRVPVWRSRASGRTEAGITPR